MGSNQHIELLGKTARDRITGFTGVVASVSFDLYGCIQVVLSPPLDKDGKMQEGRWLDVHRVEIVDEKRVMPVPKFGPPQFGATPQQHSHGPAEKPERG